PKVRAMEIIHDLEGRARGPYAGAVGYVGLNGSLDAAITIRTLALQGSQLTVQSGAGIVADSDPAKEWSEAEAKARALVGLLQEASP
ncbi:MAG TPA: chorismate-binding protein, partial [Candidatus Thermoplasmatota archaeon]|nr:chorismate-binding protein [Candidatus Thermoplasmatota archaeon]